MNIPVNPELLPVIRAIYSEDIAEKLGRIRPNESQELRCT